MGFLIRIAFWFSLVLLLLPLDLGSKDAEGNSVSPLQAFLAARDAVGDVAGICERQPGVCETGISAMHTIGVRAREGARIAYELLDQKFGEPDKATQTGSVPPAADPDAAAPAEPGQTAQPVD